MRKHSYLTMVFVGLLAANLGVAYRDTYPDLSRITTAYEESVGAVYVNGNLNGTGFAIAKDKVMTAYHVVQKEKAVFYVKIAGAKYSATIQSASKSDDIAILKLKESHLSPLAVSPLFFLGEEVYSIGFTRGWGKFLSKGIVTVTEFSYADEHIYPDDNVLFGIDTHSTYGNSGGPILNREGLVIGMLVSGKEPLMFAIPGQTLLDFIRLNGE